VLKLALAFAATGFPVFPVDVFWDDERKRWRKVPCIKEWESRASINRYLIEFWWRRWPLAVPGIPLGRCGKVVVDADRHPGCVDGVALFHELDRTRGPFPVHPYNQTKGGGEHHWFAQPAMPIRWAKWAGGEVLGHGRFVVGYAVPQGECPELPQVFWNGAEFQAPPTMGTAAKPDRHVSTADPGSPAVPMVCGPPTEHQRNYANASLRNDTAELWASRLGQRNIKLNAIAYSMGRQIARGWIARDRVEEFLLRACKANGLFKDDGLAQCRATIASGINAGMKRPYHDIGAA
jgi:hypothetical protein